MGGRVCGYVGRETAAAALLRLVDKVMGDGGGEERRGGGRRDAVASERIDRRRCHLLILFLLHHPNRPVTVPTRKARDANRKLERDHTILQRSRHIYIYDVFNPGRRRQEYFHN